MNKTIALSLSITCVSAWTVCGQSDSTYVASAESYSPELFKAGETTLDGFGTVSVGQKTIDNISGNRVREDGEFGAGIGMNHYYTRFLGLGIDAYSEDTSGPFIDNASLNLILRLPLDELHLAPYVYGGGGYQFDPGEEAFGQLGGGLEVRFTETFGIFADARYVMADESENFGVGRLGMRFLF